MLCYQNKLNNISNYNIAVKYILCYFFFDNVTKDLSIFLCNLFTFSLIFTRFYLWSNLWSLVIYLYFVGTLSFIDRVFIWSGFPALMCGCWCILCSFPRFRKLWVNIGNTPLCPESRNPLPRSTPSTTSSGRQWFAASARHRVTLTLLGNCCRRPPATNRPPHCHCHWHLQFSGEFEPFERCHIAIDLPSNHFDHLSSCLLPGPDRCEHHRLLIDHRHTSKKSWCPPCWSAELLTPSTRSHLGDIRVLSPPDPSTLLQCAANCKSVLRPI